MAYAVYTGDGDIRWVSNSLPDLGDANEYSMIECADDLNPDDYWVNVGAIQKRTHFPSLNDAVWPTEKGFDIIISGIPRGTTALWPDSVETLENDGRLVCSVNVKTRYRFLFEHAAYFSRKVVIDVQ